MTESNPTLAPYRRLAPADAELDLEIARIIGNVRFKQDVCLMARNQRGLSEFGRLFYLMTNLDNRRLEEFLDFIDEVRESHRRCLRCSLKFVAFCRFFCGIQLPGRLAAYEREYDYLLGLFGPGRDFMSEVWEAIDKARPVLAPDPPENSRLRERSLESSPT
jgi:hypothetical protein